MEIERLARQGADSLVGEVGHRGPRRRAGRAYFLVRISMSLIELARLNGLKLVPGMPVEAFIRTDERTMLSYFFKPLTDQARRAFREK